MPKINLQEYNKRLQKPKPKPLLEPSSSSSHSQDDFLDSNSAKLVPSKIEEKQSPTVSDDPKPKTLTELAKPTTPVQVPKAHSNEPVPVSTPSLPSPPTHSVSNVDAHELEVKKAALAQIHNIIAQSGIKIEELYKVTPLEDPKSLRITHEQKDDAFGSQSIVTHAGRVDTVRNENAQTIAKRVDHISQFGNLKVGNRTGIGNVDLPFPPQTTLLGQSNDYTIYSEKSYTLRVSRLDPRTTSFKPAFLQKAFRANFLTGASAQMLEIHRALDTGICTQSSEDLFAMDTYYVLVYPNPEMFVSPLVELISDCIPYAKENLFRIYLPSTDIAQTGLQKSRIASGLILAGLNFAVNSHQILHLHKNEYMFGSEGMQNFPLTAFRNKKGYKEINPLFCLLPQSTSLMYLRPMLLEYDGLFRYGRHDNLIQTTNNDPALVSTYINVDFVAAKASNLSMQRFMNFQGVREHLALGLEAYGFSNSQIDVHQLVEDPIRFGHVTTSRQKLTSFLVTASLTNSLYDIILETNVDAFTSWGTVLPNTLTPSFNTITTLGNDRIVSEIMNVAYAESTYDEAIIELVKQVTVPLRWASFTPLRYKQKDVACYYKLLEIMLAFQFYPQRCKEAGAGLSTTLYSIFEILWPADFSRFIENYGMANMVPNDSIPVDDRDYWSNSRIPSIYLRIAADRLAQNNPIDQVLRLIRPFTDPIPHTAAHRAHFPRVLGQTFTHCPYSPAQESGMDLTPFKRRLLDIIAFIRLQIDYFTTHANMSKPSKNIHYAFFNNMEAAISNHGLGFGRNIRIPLYHLINRQTMVMDYYDGSLGTPFPAHLCLTSSEDPTEQPFQRVISLDPQGCIFRTQTVWQLIYGVIFPELVDGIRSGSNDNCCFFVPPEPGLGYGQDEEIFSKCQAVTTPLGIATSLITNDRNSPGIRMVNALLGNVRYRKSDFVTVYKVIQHMVNQDTKLAEFFSIGSVKNALGLKDTVDLRVPDLALRELSDVELPLNPNQDSPACVREPLNLVEDTFYERFILGVDALASPNSAYSVLRTGIIIHKKDDVHLNPYHPTPDCDWPHEREFDEVAHCRPVLNEGVQSIIYHDGDVAYTNASEFPRRRFTLTNLDRLSSRAIGYLTSGALAGRFRIELPNLVYTKSIQPLEKYSLDHETQNIAQLLSKGNGRVPHITFYDTQVSTYTVQLQHYRTAVITRYFWSYSDVTDNVIVRGLCGESVQAPNGFIRPHESVCSSGRMLPNGVITYDNTLPKDLRTLSFTNPVYGITDKADFSGLITYSYRPMSMLT